MSISNIIFFLKLTNMNITITITTISTIITNMTTMTNIIIFLKLTNMNNPLSTTCPPNPIPPPIVRGKCFNLDPKEKENREAPTRRFTKECKLKCTHNCIEEEENYIFNSNAHTQSNAMYFYSVHCAMYF